MKLKIGYKTDDGGSFVCTYDTVTNTFEGSDGGSGPYELDGQTVRMKGAQPTEVKFASWPNPAPGATMRYTTDRGWKGEATILSVD